MVIRRLLLLGVAVGLLAAAPVQAQDGGDSGAEDAGIIEGVVRNGTEGGSSVDGVEVVLKSYGDNQLLGSESVTVGEDGAFVFSGLSTAHQIIYQVDFEYMGVNYFSEPIIFVEGEPIDPLEMVVYDTTSDASVISVATAHTIATVDEAGLDVREVSLIVNGSDRAFVGSETEALGEGRRPTLKFSLPAGASGLEIVSGLTGFSPFGTEYGFLHTMPVPPGETAIEFSYRVDGDPDGYTFTRQAFYPTSQYALMVQSETLQAEGMGLVAQDTLDMQGTRFLYLTAQSISPGQTVSAVLSEPSAGLSAVVWVLVGVALVAAAGGLIYSRRRAAPAEPEAGAQVQDDTEPLLAEIARLDDEFEAGRLDEADYRSQRDAIKSHLVDMMTQSPSADGGP